MSFYKKYLKYKNKYLKLKNQTGGNYKLNLEEWQEIENSGQKNSGIFISNIYPKYLLKCGTTRKKAFYVNTINSKIQLFPKIIDNTKIENKIVCTTMQKLDGDITNLFFNIFPKIILGNMLKKGIINEEQKDNLFKIFEGKIFYSNYNSKALYQFYNNELTFDFLLDPEIFCMYIDYLNKNRQSINTRTNIIIKSKTYNNIFNHNITNTTKEYEQSKKILEKIKKIIQNISFKLYDDFMKELTKMWSDYYEIIIKEMIKIILILYELGYCYEDEKFDNFGYILSVTPILNDFRNYRAPKIFNQYLYVYFLDQDSGLYKINNNREEVIKQIINNVNTSLSSYVVNGQFPITSINHSVLPIITYDLELLGINDEVKKILETDYDFDTSRFNNTFTNIDEIKSLYLN